MADKRTTMTASPTLAPLATRLKLRAQRREEEKALYEGFSHADYLKATAARDRGETPVVAEDVKLDDQPEPDQPDATPAGGAAGAANAAWGAAPPAPKPAVKGKQQ